MKIKDMEAIHTFTNKTRNEIFEIFYDQNPSSPREWDPLGKIYAQHRRYSLGDKDANEDELKEAQENGVCLNVYMFEHSGIALSTQPFNDPWDSGQVGYIYATRDMIVKEYKVKRISKQVKAKVEKILSAEIEEFSQYLNGEVYGYIHSKLETCDHNEDHKTHLDSCWGYYVSNSEELLAEIVGKDKCDWEELKK